VRVAFDGACLGDLPVTGVGRAFLNALAAYVPLADVAPLLLLPPGVRDPGLTGVTPVAAPRGALRRQLQLPRLLRSLAVDVLHSPVAAVPLRARCATVATVHDLPWLCPESSEPSSRWRRFATTRSLRAASAVIAPSHFTLAAARRLLAGGRALLRCVPNGVVLPSAAPPDPELRSGDLLVLGDDRPRKNRQRVQEAHTRARARCPELPPLCFCGPPDAYVDEAEKLQLLRDCRAVVQCALFEGFGMPVLEALAHGAPVVCSDIAPHREIAGDAALRVDPRDVEAIAAAMIRIDTDAPLRQELVAGGQQRAAGFAVDTTARQWLMLHRELCA